jgi:hypothetical protein
MRFFNSPRLPISVSDGLLLAANCSLSSSDIGRAEFRWWRRRRTGKRNILHAEIGEQSFNHLLFL